MKVLNLLCAQQHLFEGWFASEDDFQSQLLRDLVQCPMCESKSVEKMPSAPRLNLGGYQAPADSSTSQTPSPNASANLPAGPGDSVSSRDVAATGTAGVVSAGRGGQADFLISLRHLLANTEDVGRRFAAEARGMHYGDIEARSIRGQASAREAVELMEEGIEVMPVPAALKETLQ